MGIFSYRSRGISIPEFFVAPSYDGACKLVIGCDNRNERRRPMDWIKAFLECSLSHVWQALRERLEADIREYNELSRG
jgi:hypothetical protein